jgi:hypothetical protein
LLAACASTKTSTSTSGSPSTSPSRAATRTGTAPAVAAPAPAAAPSEGFKPAGAGAKNYSSVPGEGRKALPPDPVRKALLEEVRAAARKQGVAAPEADVRLDWAMTDLARQVRGDDLPALDVVEFLLAHYGLVEPSPHILLSSAPSQGAIEVGPAARGEITEMMKAADIGRVGIGVDRAGDTTYVAIALQERRVTLLGSIPRRLPPGGQATIAARLPSGLAHPGIAITAPDGTVR